MKKISILFLLLISFSLISFGQSGNDQKEKVVQKLTRYQQSRPGEKAYLHLDKSIYSPGEDIWFRGYMLNAGNHSPQVASSVLYVELLDPLQQLVSHRTIEILNGVGKGDFSLPDSVPPGEYLIRAYTRNMENFDPSFFFYKTITILPLSTESPSAEPASSKQDVPLQSGSSENSPRINLAFFPEGGNLVANLQSRIAFKATDSVGQSLEIEGKIINENGDVLTHFKSYKFGTGEFFITPQQEEVLTAVTTYQDREYRFPLPEVAPDGFQMSIRQSHGKIFVQALSTSKFQMEGCFVVGHLRGRVFSIIPANKEKSQIYAVLPGETIPSGVAHFTLFDKNGIPQSERLLYLDHHQDKTSLKIETTKDSFTSREMVKFELALRDFKGHPLPGNLSATAIEKGIYSSLKNENNIRSYFLLKSDLKGEIENPGYYFDTLNQDREHLMDLLMLTQGWRRFVWKDVLTDSIITLPYLPENGFTIEGELYKFHNRSKKTEGKVNLSFLEDPLTLLTDTTGENGYFQFKGLNIYDTVTVFLQANKIDRKQKNQKENDPIFIKVQEQKRPEVQAVQVHKRPKVQDNVFQNYLKIRSKINQFDSIYNFDSKIIVLNEVEVVKKKPKEKGTLGYVRESALYQEPDNRLILDSILSSSSARDIFSLLQGRVAGVQVYTNGFGEQTVRIRGTNSLTSGTDPLFLVDGMPMEMEFVSTLSPMDVAVIDVLKGTSTSIYGSRGANGVIAIYTRRGVGQTIKEDIQGVAHFKHPGYSIAREFYTPDYSEKKPEHIKPDFRSTHYWNPEVKTGEDGKSQVEFFTSDEKGEFVLYVEGITSDGRPVVGEKFYKVE